MVRCSFLIIGMQWQLHLILWICILILSYQPTISVPLIMHHAHRHELASLITSLFLPLAHNSLESLIGSSFLSLAYNLRYLVGFSLVPLAHNHRSLIVSVLLSLAHNLRSDHPRNMRPHCIPHSLSLFNICQATY